VLPTSPIDQRDTHRLIPAQYADGGASVLARLTGDQKTLDGIFELDNATNDRLLAESRLAPGIDERELVFGIPSYRIINAAFCHPSPTGSRFGSSERGVWYASFELETSQAEVAYHRQLWLQETAWDEEDRADYVDYLADFHAEFHDLRDIDLRNLDSRGIDTRNRDTRNVDLREAAAYKDCLSPTSYVASQALGAELLQLGSAGIVYPSVRRRGGTCLGCFRPVLVTNVRKGYVFTFVFSDSRSAPKIRRVGL
jgi:RES domain-containing protein